MADDDQEYRRQMAAHHARKQTEFLPYHQRISDGACTYEERDDKVYITIAVAELGTLTIGVEPRYNTKLRRFWNQDAVLSAKIE